MRNGNFDFNRFKRVKIAGLSFRLPDFVVDEPDFRLQPGSPCIDTGTIEGASATDIEGHVRPCDAGVDIGPYEFGGCLDTLFERGDPNADGNVDLSDAIFVLNFLFLGGPSPTCMDSADMDDGGAVNITDAIYLLNFLFLSGRSPEDPFPICGADKTGDALTCASFPRCE